MELNKAYRGVERTISRRVVGIFKDHLGRGPTNARTVIAEDLVVVILQDTLTAAEHTLADDEREELVHEMRRSFQGTMRDEMVATVEEELGRNVRVFLSDHSIDPDYAVEVFILEGDGGGGPARESDPPDSD